MKPPWCWDTDHLGLSCSNANDACKKLIRQNDFCFLEDLFNWVVAAHPAIYEWFSININSLEEGWSSGGSVSSLLYLAAGRLVFRGLVSLEKMWLLGVQVNGRHGHDETETCQLDNTGVIGDHLHFTSFGIGWGTQYTPSSCSVSAFTMPLMMFSTCLEFPISASLLVRKKHDQ